MERIVSLVADLRGAVPQLLDLLRVLVKVKEAPVRRNQVLIMKYFMRSFNKVAGVFDESPAFR